MQVWVSQPLYHLLQLPVPYVRGKPNQQLSQLLEWMVKVGLPQIDGHYRFGFDSKPSLVNFPTSLRIRYTPNG